MAFYVYFRSTADDTAVAAALGRSVAMLVAAGWPAPTLWRRPLAGYGRRTWMEVHPPQPVERAEALLVAMAAAADASGLLALVDGERHVERFEQVAPSDLRAAGAS